MNEFNRMLLIGGLVLGGGALLTGCDVDQTQEGEMPDAQVSEEGQLPRYEVRQTQEGALPDVDVEGGQLPRYDVETADVNVGTRETEVTVPEVDVDVDSRRETVDVPTIDVDMPEEDEDDN